MVKKVFSSLLGLFNPGFITRITQQNNMLNIRRHSFEEFYTAHKWM